MLAYLIQVSQIYPSFGKQTIMVEYDKTIEIDGKTVYHNSMGYFQFYLNFEGMSKYY